MGDSLIRRIVKATIVGGVALGVGGAILGHNVDPRNTGYYALGGAIAGALSFFYGEAFHRRQSHQYENSEER